MNYEVWTKDDINGWQRSECAGLDAAKTEVLKAVRAGQNPIITMAIPYSVNIELQGGIQIEAPKSEAEHDQSTGAPRNGAL